MVLGYITAFVFGCFMGSFLNCVAYRLENKKSFVKGRSFCPKCKHDLAWHDLVPLFSFFFLLGKCRYCKNRISVQYLIVEVATGLLLILNFKFLILNQALIFNFKTVLDIIYLLAITCILEIIFIYDLRNYIIPDKLVFSAIGLALVYQLIFNFELLPYLGLGVVVSSGFFFLLWLVSRGRWMGFGDVKLALFMGLFLGWPNILAALFFAFISGSIIGLILISLGKKAMKSQVPFGPFLIAGTFFGLFWGGKIINWYLGLTT